MLAMFYQMKSKKNKSEAISEDYYDNILRYNDIDVKGEITMKCRICLKDGSTSIYNNDVIDNSLIEVFDRFLNINLKEKSYPQHFCSVCFKVIKTFVVFRKTAKHTDILLKKFIEKEDNIFEQVEDHHSCSDNEYDINESVNKKCKENEKANIEKNVSIKHPSKITCHICNKVMNRSYYKEHITMHDPNHKNYVCDICGKSFRLRCAYHNHSLRHRTDFPYKCQFCPYRGRYAELLKTHMRTHTGDYRYMCTECPARFLFKSNLNSHSLKHKEPKYKCDACKRAFHTKVRLQQHVEADHLGVKNHICNTCGKAFGYRKGMMKHQRDVHKRAKLVMGRMPANLQAETENQDGS